jgi:hypothetical protein
MYSQSATVEGLTYLGLLRHSHADRREDIANAIEILAQVQSSDQRKA